MPITIHGPDWPTVRELRAALAAVPEVGTFIFGGRKHPALEQLTRFRSASVPTVEFTNSRATAQSWVREGQTVFARRQYHTHGSDIIKAGPGVPPGTRWYRRDWWSKFVPSREEWRIHVFAGKVIARGVKTFPGVAPHESWPVRSRRNGWIITHTTEPSEAVRATAKAAVAALGYTYGAVDLLVGHDGRIWVLEVNLLPAMDDYTRGKYVEAIRKFVRGEGNLRADTVPHPTPRPRVRAAVAGGYYEGVEVM